MDYAVKLSGINTCSTGIGILYDGVSDIHGIESVMNYACPAFRYVALYTGDTEMAANISDMVFSKFGLPLSVSSAAGFQGCRYPVKMDFSTGKLRLGRDLCLVGTDASGKIVRG